MVEYYLNGYYYPNDWDDARIVQSYRLQVKADYLAARDRWKRAQTAADAQLSEQIIKE